MLVHHMASLRRAVPEARASWSRPENIHLTLKFFGDIPITAVENVSTSTAHAVEGLVDFKIQVSNPGVFPSHGSPRVLWIGVRDVTGKLAELHARLENEAAKVGFEKETRAFHPHLTLARFREHQRRTKQSSAEEAQLARALVSEHKDTQLPSMEIAVSELLVIRSELSREGSRYTVVSRHPLGMSGKL